MNVDRAALLKATRTCLRVVLGAILALVAVVSLRGSSAWAAPSCLLNVSPPFAIGETDVSIQVASSAANLSEAGSSRIWLFVDSQTKPTLIGQDSSAGGLGASAEYTVHLTPGSHRIEVACQSASGTTYASADINVFNPGTVVVIGIFGLLGIAVIAGLANSQGKGVKTAGGPKPTAPPPPMASNDAVPVLASSTPQLLRGQNTESRGSGHRCADATADRNALIDLLRSKQSLESLITNEWNQQARTTEVLLDVYRSLCDEKRNLWIATGLNWIEGSAAWTYWGASFAHDVAEDVGKATGLTIPSLDKGLNIVFTRRGAKLLAEALTKVTVKEGAEKVGEMALDKLNPGAENPPGLEKQGDVKDFVQRVLDRNAKVHGELVDKLTDAFAADIAEYLTNAQAYNASVLRWSTEKQEAMEALARKIDAAHRALASSFLDCHGRLFDDSALQSGNVDLGGAGLRLAVGDPSDLEVPVDVAFTSSR